MIQTPACNYCKNVTHTWSTPDFKRVCFSCMRKQRDEAMAERDEARSFAQGVYRWGPRAQIPLWEERLPWLKGGEVTDLSPFEDHDRGRLALLEATVKVIHRGLTQLMEAMEGLE